MGGTFLPEDVTILLKDITGTMRPIPTEARESMIQRGVHYSEMLPLEYRPTDEYMNEYERALLDFSGKTAQAVAAVGDRIYRKKGKSVVLVSLARSGTPIGVLLKRYMLSRYGVSVAHYTISIVRGRGIDGNAMKTILARHPAESLQFVDGWIGKGAIAGELAKSLSGAAFAGMALAGVDKSLAVLSDPAGVTSMCGTRDDFLVPSSCLNSTVCGLMSRTVLNENVVGPEDFHGVVYYDDLASEDRTYQFIQAVESHFGSGAGRSVLEEDLPAAQGLEEARKIANDFGVADINLLKPGIGETTRVLLRRMPGVILMRKDADPKAVSHILRLAKDKNAPVEEYPLKRYAACGIIKKLAADA
ncbi:MAG: cysteine protease StiP family protein [Synergistaceae bacterium]|jgi:hypothetical protein|nr:cysteine protease StiP family protein [Synergistaceae bacterium]